jgi:hypothetical protein
MSRPLAPLRWIAWLAASLALAAMTRTALAQHCTDPCTDNNVCTVNDHCSGDHCRGPTLPDGTSCDDGNPDTVDDVCMAGVCEGVFSHNASDTADSGAGGDDGGAPPAPAVSDHGGCAVGTAVGSHWGVVTAALAAWGALKRRSAARR